MLNRSIVRQLPLGLFFWSANIFLATLFLVFTFSGNATPPVELRPVLLQDLDLKNSLARQQNALKDVDAAYTQPFFHSDRHAATKPEEPLIRQVAQKPKFELMGILQVSHNEGWAFLKTDNSTETFRVAVGENLQGWMLEEIEADHVVISSGIETETLFLGNDILSARDGQAKADNSGTKPRTRKKR